jgi:hypothetical protein
MLTCPVCTTYIMQGEPIALVETRGENRLVFIVHLAPCGLMLLALRRTTRVDALLRSLARQSTPA